jgi:hypothetical protein
MPCYDDRNEPDNVRAEAKKEFQADLDKLTRLLCCAMKILDLEFNPGGYVGTWGDEGDGRELYEWWKEHQKRDKERAKRGK